ncbi:NADH-FMN oxidoreductase RutF, flavin reductase (DIM6/NTAB) family [Quadrisphaera granulorum]|uniref:Flavin reductase (DIM6/NTAB) family NADH-FMN oxidoreductase RutF n=1 Tax=Quadrisphaera granulorum TaxID=317664 RepID=A0A315ZU09_9ACTN|nr:flavin reductase family protein [Quadrisphaera granulorum]PWJ49041.1 flavin reductase (DIM6/NTAB) family NADH-FMN oxidoreductase RutF [Quadrisphaera granulorum]SZE98251.1 NADH-FMN oxidoreductase RutF, flavin reductase (DIM6/NTAB) family [Quadrisphaera granulorum]
MTCTAAATAPVVDLPGAFRTVASSAWVVTTRSGDRPVGFTAISVASVSLQPPLLSFNVSRSSSSIDALLSERRAAVHLLADGQEHLARRFAASAAGRFPEDGSWTWDETGLPELPGVVARLAGPVHEVIEAGDSVVLLVRPEVTAVAGGTPLVHHARAYHRLEAL